MSRVNTSLSAIFSILCLLSFRFIEIDRSRPVEASNLDKTDGNEMVCESETFEYIYSSSVRYRQYCDSLYFRIFNESNRPNRKVFDLAMKGYANCLGNNLLLKKNLLAFIDYSLSSNKKRLWVIDLKEFKVLYHELVAHGRNTGEEYARKFSNKENSFQSSMGFFVTGEIYSGKHDISVKMNGLEKYYNGKAFDRGIVIHGADYVSEDYIQQNKRLGRSLGCPAVSDKIIDNLSKTICDGVCLFSYYNNASYLRNSKILKADMVYAKPIVPGL